MSIDDFPLRHRMRVRYSEIDAQGVVFNAHYLTYFDTAINEAFRGRDIDWLTQVRNSGCDVQLVKSLVEYKAPLHFDELFDVAAGVSRLGNSSITWSLGVFGEQADMRASGEIVWVYADLAAKRATALPTWLREAVEPLLIAPRPGD